MYRALKYRIANSRNRVFCTSSATTHEHTENSEGRIFWYRIFKTVTTVDTDK